MTDRELVEFAATQPPERITMAMMNRLDELGIPDRNRSLRWAAQLWLAGPDAEAHGDYEP